MKLPRLRPLIAVTGVAYAAGVLLAPWLPWYVQPVLALAAGIAGAWLFDRATAELREAERRLQRIHQEAIRETKTPEHGAARRLLELEGCVEELRLRLGATRAVLWAIDADAGEALPRVVAAGATPMRIVLAGDPLGWAWSERVVMRLDSPQRWAPNAAACWVAPVDSGAGAALLSFDFDSAELPEQSDVVAAADRCAAFLRLDRLQAQAAASAHRSDRLLELLRRLARDIDLPDYSRELAEAARELAEGTGALVALWQGSHGEVVARVGEDGGPEPGSRFDAESQLGIAARALDPIDREFPLWARREPPIGHRGEDWVTGPRWFVALPLTLRDGATIGVLALWSSRREMEGVGLEAVKTLAPYAALQLRNASAYRELRDTALRDPLTGLHNRRAFDARLTKEAEHFGRYRRPVSLVMLDIDHFKQINDVHGHEAGDAVLRIVADIIRAGIRGTDFAARFGGEEFVLLMPETRLDEATEAAERLRAALEARHFEWQGAEIRIRASFGVTCAPDCVADTTKLVASADAMLYESKRSGRNLVTAAAGVPAAR